MISIRSAIADGLYSRDQFRYTSAKDIVSVEFRRGCAEIEVTYEVDERYDGDSRTTDIATIDAAPVLTAMLQKMVDEDRGHIPLEDQ